MATTTSNGRVIDVTPAQLEKWLDEGEAVLIDVREDYEHASERIPRAEHAALSTLEPEKLREAYGTKRVVFHCRTGRRAADAAQRYARQAAGDGEAYCLAGGLEAWKAGGRPTVRPAGAPPIDVMRQVQITAGSLVLIGVLLGAFVSPWFLLLSGFVGGGLVFAGASGWCGMARLLSLMPWNRRA